MVYIQLWPGWFFFYFGKKFELQVSYDSSTTDFDSISKLLYTAVMSNTNSMSPLSCLPVELLEGVLSHLRTKELLRVSTVSQRVYASVDYIVRQRFRNFESLDGHHLIFECSPPSRRVRIPLSIRSSTVV